MGFEKTGRTGLGDNAQPEKVIIQGRIFTGDDAVQAREDMKNLYGINVDETEDD